MLRVKYVIVKISSRMHLCCRVTLHSAYTLKTLYIYVCVRACVRACACVCVCVYRFWMYHLI